jgi:hypothetical protein
MEGAMGWAEVVGKLPARLLTLVAAIACAAFIALVGVTLWSIFYTGVPIQIANYEFGPVVPPPPAAIPAGAVVAFENYDPDRCPPGWEPSLPTRGRLILGAGDAKVQTNRLSIDERGKALKNFALLQHGGDLARINFKDLASDQPITPYENMLPWVALTFCKKSRKRRDELPRPDLFFCLAALVAAGACASYRFFEFFTAQIWNPNTRRAYARAAVEFFDWLAARGVTQITAIESVHVANYIETGERS